MEQSGPQLYFWGEKQPDGTIIVRDPPPQSFSSISRPPLALTAPPPQETTEADVRADLRPGECYITKRPGAKSPVFIRKKVPRTSFFDILVNIFVPSMVIHERYTEMPKLTGNPLPDPPPLSPPSATPPPLPLQPPQLPQPLITTAPVIAYNEYSTDGAYGQSIPYTHVIKPLEGPELGQPLPSSQLNIPPVYQFYSLSPAHNVPSEPRIEEVSSESLPPSQKRLEKMAPKHVCANCGKSRSASYHHKHPLKKGEIPAPGFCRKCRKKETSSEGSPDGPASYEKDKSRDIVHRERVRIRYTHTSESDELQKPIRIVRVSSRTRKPRDKIERIRIRSRSISNDGPRYLISRGKDPIFKDNYVRIIRSGNREQHESSEESSPPRSPEPTGFPPRGRRMTQDSSWGSSFREWLSNNSPQRERASERNSHEVPRGRAHQRLGVRYVPSPYSTKDDIPESLEAKHVSKPPPPDDDHYNKTHRKFPRDSTEVYEDRRSRSLGPVSTRRVRIVNVRTDSPDRGPHLSRQTLQKHGSRQVKFESEKRPVKSCPQRLRRVYKDESSPSSDEYSPPDLSRKTYSGTWSTVPEPSSSPSLPPLPSECFYPHLGSAPLASPGPPPPPGPPPGPPPKSQGRRIVPLEQARISSPPQARPEYHIPGRSLMRPLSTPSPPSSPEPPKGRSVATFYRDGSSPQITRVRYVDSGRKKDDNENDWDWERDIEAKEKRAFFRYREL